MSIRALLVDGTDVSTYGLVVSEIEGWRDGPKAGWPDVQPIGRIGSVRTSTEPTIEQRNLRITGTALATSLSNLLSNLDNLKVLLGTSERTFIFTDDETRKFVGRVTGVSARGINPHLTQRGCEIEIDVLMNDPRIFATTSTTVSSIGASATDLPLGTAISIPTITVSTAGTFTLTYKNSAGTTVSELTITGATAPVVINMDAGTITDAGGNAIPYLGTTDDFPFYFDPQDGDYPTSDWPTLEVSAGTAEAVYDKAYW